MVDTLSIRYCVVSGGVSPGVANPMVKSSISACATEKAGSSEAAGSETFFVGGVNTNQVEFGRAIARVLGKKRILPVRVPGMLLGLAALTSTIVGKISKNPRIFTFGNVRRFIARNWSLDCTKAERLLGYRPVYDLEATIEEAISWYRDQGLL